MNLFQLEYFVTLAETLSYTRASQKLHITQPNLSKMIIHLEHLTGSQLFIRNKRDVKLTPAGKVFYHDVKKMLTTYDGALEKIKNMENGTTGVINLGFFGTTMAQLLPLIINQFSSKYPTIKINPLDYSYSRIMDSLQNGELDMAICPDLELDTIPGLIKTCIFKDEMCLVVPQDHKFAKLDTIDLVRIKNEPLINMNPKDSRRDHNFINHICLNGGFLPNTVYEASTLLNLMVMVDCKVGCTILAGHMRRFATNTIRFVPIKGLEEAFHVVCIHTGAPTNECVPRLLEVIDQGFL